MKYVLMAISIMLSVVNACLLRKFSETNKEKEYSVFLFNTGVSVVWIVILTASFAISDCEFSPGAILYGAVYGVILSSFLLFKTQSMAEGPVSLSTLIGSCAFVIATWFGVVYANETVNLFQLIGMALLLVSLMLCVNPKKSGEKLTGKWMLYCLGFFLAGGAVGILYKLFGKSDASRDVDAMMLAASVVSAVLFAIVGLTRAKRSGTGSIKPHKAAVIFMILSGIASCVYIRMNLSLSNMIPSVIFFPVSNGGMVILSTIGARLLFKERLNKMQISGIVIGCIAVVLTGCGETLLQALLQHKF